MLLITPCISASQIAVHGPPFRNTEDSQRSMESWQLAWDWLHLFAASYFDRCPRSSLLWRDWRPLRAAGSLKKKQQKTKPQEHTTDSTATTVQTESSNVLIGNATSSLQQYLYSSSTLALYLCTLWLKRKVCSARVSHLGEGIRPGCACNAQSASSPRLASACAPSWMEACAPGVARSSLRGRSPSAGHGALLAQAQCPAPTATASRQLRAWAEKTSVCLQNSVCTSPLSHDFTFDLPLTNSLLEQHLLCVAQLSRRSIFRMEVKE